jgi:hypothetical protein
MPSGSSADASKVIAAFDALVRAAMRDPALRAGSATAGIVVILVGMQPEGPMTRPATLGPARAGPCDVALPQKASAVDASSRVKNTLRTGADRQSRRG